MTTTTDMATRDLRPGEKLVWSGRGDPSVVFGRSDAFLIPFSLLWGGFAIVWEIIVITTGAGALFAVFGAVFVVVGLYFIIGRFFVKAHRKRTTVYAVTDRRAFLTNGRTMTETGLVGVERATTWSRDRGYVSVIWNTGGGIASGIFAAGRNPWPGNSGMDGIGTPRQMAFYDVRDGEALVSALNES